MIGGKFAPLTIMDNEDTDLDSMITTFNTAVIEAASEILGKRSQKKKKKTTTLGHCRLDHCETRKLLVCATKEEN